MVRKAMNILQGIKATSVPPSNKGKKYNQNIGIDPKDRIDICLACKKPAKECKGNCFGGVG